MMKALIKDGTIVEYTDWTIYRGAVNVVFFTFAGTTVWGGPVSLVESYDYDEIK